VAAKEESITLETTLFRIVFSNRGGVVRSWVLKRYKDQAGKELDLVNPKAAGKVPAPFSVRFHNNQSSDDLNNALWVATVAPDRLSVQFEVATGPWTGRKSLALGADSYVAKVESDIRNSGTPKPHLLYWRGGFGDFTVVGAAAAQKTQRLDLATGKLQSLLAGDADDGAEGYQAHRGRFAFAGIADSYFAALAVPEVGRDFEIHSFSDNVPNSIDGKEDPHVGMAIGGDPLNRFSFFVGPKDTDLLKSVSPMLPRVVDYGWFTIIAEPLFMALHWFNDKFFHNWGWTIIIVTVIINFLLLPLKITSLKSMRQMAVLQPRIKEINDKYKGMSFKDPRKQEQQQEVMELYKKHGVNPMSGCMPLALQIPFFIAFYNVLANAIELRGASWLWVSDLSRPENFLEPIRILPLAMIASQFFMQKMTPSTAPDPQQQRIMLMMPLFLGFMFYGVSSGLVLYWVTGNLVGIAQQLFFNRMMPALPVHAPAKKKGAK